MSTNISYHSSVYISGCVASSISFQKIVYFLRAAVILAFHQLSLLRSYWYAHCQHFLVNSLNLFPKIARQPIFPPFIKYFSDPSMECLVLSGTVYRTFIFFAVVDFPSSWFHPELLAITSCKSYKYKWKHDGPLGTIMANCLRVYIVSSKTHLPISHHFDN